MVQRTDPGIFIVYIMPHTGKEIALTIKVAGVTIQYIKVLRFNA